MFSMFSRFTRVTSSSNPRVKSAVRLQNARQRRKDGMFLIDGFRELSRAVDSGIEILELFFEERLFHSNGGKGSECGGDNDSGHPEEWETLLRDIREKAHSRSPANAPQDFRKRDFKACEVFVLTDRVYEKLAFGQRRSGVIAVAKAKSHSWNEVRLTTNPLLAVVEGIEKPGNLGAVFRSADGAGVEAVFIADPLCDLYNPNTIRASLGTVFRVPAVLGTAEEIFYELVRRGISPAAARCDDPTPYTNFDFTQSCAIVLGTEAEGLSPIWHREEVRSIHVPMLGIADSLNVSNAAAVLFYEARRQRDLRSEVPVLSFS